MKQQIAICDRCGIEGALDDSELRSTEQMNSKAWRYKVSDDPEHPLFTPEVEIQIKVWARDVDEKSRHTQSGDICRKCLGEMLGKYIKELFPDGRPND